jgi:hypothetical protein
LAQTALALADISQNNSGAACCRLEIECVLYWEWAKLIATAVLISICTTTIGFSIWWWLSN